MVDPKNSTICSKTRGYSSIRSSSPNSLLESHPSFNKMTSNLKKSTPLLTQKKSLSTKVSPPPSEAILNRPLLSRTKSGSTKVSCSGRNRSGHTIPPNTTDIDTTTTLRTNNQDPQVSDVVIGRTAVRRHKSRLTISPSMDNVSTLENDDLENDDHDPENDDPDVVETDGVGDGVYLLSKGNGRKRRRGVCNSSTISQMLRTNKEPLKVRLDVGHGRPVGEKTSSLLSHAIGEQVRRFLPVHIGYWKKVDDSKKDESIRSLMTYFDFELDEEGRLEEGISEYLDKEFAKLFREFKSELHSYYQQYSHDDAKCNPPLQWEKRKIEDWITMCDHFLSERFQKQSNANRENRDKKQYNHHGGSKPISLRYEEHVQKGSQFPDIDAFKETYTDKDGNWKSDVVKKYYEEMESQRNALLKELAAGYPEGTPSDEITVPEDSGRKILMNILGTKPGREIRGLGFGRYRVLASSSTTQRVASSVHFKELKKELANEKAARQNMERFVHTLVKELSTKVPGLSLPQELNTLFGEEDDDILSP